MLDPRHVDAIANRGSALYAMENLPSALDDFQQALKDAKEMDRHSGIVRQATPRGLGEPVHEDYYLDPFVKEAP